MKRFLKWFAISLCVILAVPILAGLGIWGYSRTIIWSKPGSLKVGVAPGAFGAKVDPFIGTGGFTYMCAHNTVAAATPFGMMRLSPDTESILIKERALNRSGYYYNDNRIIGFSHTRLVGADAKEGGVFRIFPTVASRVEKNRAKDRFARFSHRNEAAFPGYYAVVLPKDKVLVELTATPRVGVHRYTFRKGEAPHLLVDVTSAIGKARCEDGMVRVIPEAHEIEGKVKCFGSFSGRYGGLDVYFVARFSEPFAEFGTWSGASFRPGADGAAGNDIGIDLGFAGQGEEQVVEVRLAISYVSMANARLNLEAEAAGKSFEEVFALARDAWEKRLSTVRIQGGTDEQQRVFYTALYRAFQMPTEFNDVNGEYIGFDRAIHKAEGFKYYTDFSLWDTFRTVQPLYNVIARADQRDMMMSLVEMAKAGGCLPRWPSGCGYTNCMFGTPADVAVSEAYLKGIHDFDIETAYKCMRQTALVGVPAGSKFGGREALPEYLSLGYCPVDKTSDAVSATLEAAWSDHALMLLAQELGHTEDAALFAQHAKSYRNIWNPDAQFFQPKDSQGNFPKQENFKPLLLTYVDFDRKYTRGYVEGSAMQWRWSVPYDPEGLISLFRSKDYFISELENYMANAKPGPGGWNPGGYYWHGNEPYINAPYLFNAAGRPDLTQKWVRWVLDNEYSDSYFGLDGNDDGGTLSSWYVFSALGFYPIAGTTRYELGTPLFEKADIQIGDKTLSIVAVNYGPKNLYVQKIALNSKPLDRTWIAHDEIAPGGTLQFEMGPSPAVP